MQIERINTSTHVLVLSCLAANLIWASCVFAQENAKLPRLPVLTATAPKPTVNPTGSQLTESTVVTIDPNQIVLNAIRQAVWGPAIGCKVYQRSHAFGQQVIVSGDYKASGLGLGQFRYNARVSSGETTFDTVQVSDGRLMFTQIGSDEPPRRVNIDQVRQSLGNAIHPASQRPEVSFYLAIGGHPELLRCLYHRYRWYKAVTGSIGGVEVWQLVGILRTERPKLFGNAELDKQTMGIAHVGSNLPTEVRLTLGRSVTAAYFPYMVEYFRRTKSADGQPDAIELLSVLEHTEPTTSVTIVDKDFIYKVQDSVDKIDDETSLYMPTEPTADQSLFPFR